MRIAFDARHAARGLGISTFVTHLARELARLDGVELVWLGDPRLAPPLAAGFVSLGHAPYPLLDGPLGRARLARLHADVVHFTGNTGWGRPGPVPHVLTLHDLIFLGTRRADRSIRQQVGHRYERSLIGRALAAAAIVAVPSRTVADQVTARFGPAVQPRVVLEGVAPPAPPLAGPASAAGERAPYIVAFAGRDPRKRTGDVVNAWRALQPSPIRLRLLAAGGLPDGLANELGAELADRRVEILEHLPREQLWRVMSGALALVYPSVDEGFGLPVLEGMAVGTPVLAGIAPVTREIGADAIVAIDPVDVPGSIAAAVRRLFEDPECARAIAERGRARAATFTWRRTAEGYRDLYREAIAGRDQARPGPTVRQ